MWPFDRWLERGLRRQLDREYLVPGLEELYIDAVVGRRRCQKAIALVRDADRALGGVQPPLARPGMVERERRRLLLQQKHLSELHSALGDTMREAWQALYRSARRNGFSGGYDAWRNSEPARRIEEAAQKAADAE